LLDAWGYIATSFLMQQGRPDDLPATPQDPQQARPEDVGFEGAWGQVLEQWHDEAAHRQFVAFCIHTGRILEGCKRYREVKDSDPLRRSRAEEALSKLATSALSLWTHTSRSQPPTQARLQRNLMFVVGAAILMYVALQMLK